jgi:hypothetical protein
MYSLPVIQSMNAKKRSSPGPSQFPESTAIPFRGGVVIHHGPSGKSGFVRDGEAFAKEAKGLDSAALASLIGQYLLP